MICTCLRFVCITFMMPCFRQLFLIKRQCLQIISSKDFSWCNGPRVINPGIACSLGCELQESVHKFTSTNTGSAKSSWAHHTRNGLIYQVPLPAQVSSTLILQDSEDDGLILKGNGDAKLSGLTETQ